MPTAYHSLSGSRRLLSRMRQTSVCESPFQPADLFLQLAFLASFTLKKGVRVRVHTFDCVRFSMVAPLFESEGVWNFRRLCQYLAASASVSTPERTANVTFARVS